MQSAAPAPGRHLRRGLIEVRCLDGDRFFELRDRAYQLADGGRCKDWRQVAYALLAEGFEPSLIKRLDADALAVMMISRCCVRSRDNPSRSARE